MKGQIIERKELSKAHANKLRAINAMVVPTLLYGRERDLDTSAETQKQNPGIGDEVTQENRRDHAEWTGYRSRLGVEAVLVVANRKKKEWRELED